MNKAIKESADSEKLTKKDINQAALRYMFMACNTFNYENQQGPAVVYGLNKALRKIYKDDQEYKDSLNSHFNYFNTTTPMANILLGASLAMEEKDGAQAIDTVQNFKTGMMGPLAGVGDTLIWVLYPTIMGSISGYMGLQGNPTDGINAPTTVKPIIEAASVKTLNLSPSAVTSLMPEL